eukprot:403359671
MSTSGYYYRSYNDKRPSNIFGTTFFEINRNGADQENIPAHRLREIPITHTIPEHLRGHGRYGAQGNINKIEWRGQGRYILTKDGTRLL